MSNPDSTPVTLGTLEGEDERHMAAALYLIQRAIALHATSDENSYAGEIHCCLREAAGHCESARKHWTKEERERIRGAERIL